MSGEQFEGALVRLWGPRHVTRLVSGVPVWEIHRRRGWLFNWGGVDYHEHKDRLLDVLLRWSPVLLLAPTTDDCPATWQKQNEYLWRLPTEITAADLSAVLQPGGWMLYGTDRSELDEPLRERFWDAIENRRYELVEPLFAELGLGFYLDGFAGNDPWTVVIGAADDEGLAELVPAPSA